MRQGKALQWEEERRTVVEGRQSGQHLVQQHTERPPINRLVYAETVSPQIRAHRDQGEHSLYPWPFKISGARYSGVPQNVFVISESFMFNLHSPKSQRAICPV